MVNTQRGVCGVTPQSGSEVVFQMAPYSLYSALRLTRTHRALVQSCVLYRWRLWGITIRPSDEPPANLICTCGLPPPPLHSPLTSCLTATLWKASTPPTSQPDSLSLFLPPLLSHSHLPLPLFSVSLSPLPFSPHRPSLWLWPGLWPVAWPHVGRDDLTGAGKAISHHYGNTLQANWFHVGPGCELWLAGV